VRAGFPQAPTVVRARQSRKSASGGIKPRLDPTVWRIRLHGLRLAVVAAQQPCCRWCAHTRSSPQSRTTVLPGGDGRTCVVSGRRRTPWCWSVPRRVLASALCQVHAPGLQASATMRTQGAHACTCERDATMEGAHVSWHHPCIYGRSKTWTEVPG
jgi:hypothetical protein